VATLRKLPLLYCGPDYNRRMFFRRHAPRQVSFEERLQNLRGAGCAVETLGEGRVRIHRDCCAAIIVNVPGASPRVDQAGVLIGSEIASLIDGGFQKFLETPRGLRKPTLASDLKALHVFQEDLSEALGLESLYNESLGTVCDRHVYDRLTGRS
jgi:hypothetical protein